MDITIAFMTNYTLDIPNTIKQEQTIESFYKILKVTEPLTTFIFCDEKPLSEIKGKIKLFNNDEYDDYKIPGAMYENKLKNINLLKHASFIKTKGLCDGYKQALTLCKTKYLFFLEHDWIFLPNIVDSLNSLIDLMNNNNEINNILFNKERNIQLDCQKIFNTKSYNIPLLLTDRQSNNPNILRVEHAIKVRDQLIQYNGCSVHPGIEFYYKNKNMKIPNYCGGIECELCEFCNNDETKIKLLGTHLYGEINKNPTIAHSDGCDRSVLEKTGKLNC
jgi:hypothetical protein